MSALRERPDNLQNAAAFARLVAFETDRRGWYPQPGQMLAAYRRADAVTAAGGRVRLSWMDHDGKDAAQWAREKRAALHRRITAKGGARYSRHNHPTQVGVDACFVRDRESLRLIRARVRIYGFDSRAVRERFAHLLSRHDD